MTRAIRKMLEKGLVSRHQFEQAAMLKAKSGETLSFHLVQIGALTDEEIVEFLLQHFEAPYYSRARLRDIRDDVLSLVPKELSMELRLLPVAKGDGTLTIGVTDPTRSHAIEEVGFHTGREIAVVLLTETDMSFVLEHYYGEPQKFDTIPPGDVTVDVKKEVPDKPVLTKRDVGARSSWEDSDKPAVSLSPSVNIVSDAPPVPSSMPTMSSGEDGDNEERRLTEGEILSMIHQSEDRNTVIDNCLRYMLQFADRTAFFVVRKGAIRGYEIKGELTSQSAIRSYWVPLLAESTLRQVIRERRIHLGPLGRNSADAILAASLGGRPSRILAIPIEIGHRVVGLLYADRLHVTMPPWNRMERLAQVMGDNLRRIILKKSDDSDGLG